jgi:hypothetical protein
VTSKSDEAPAAEAVRLYTSPEQLTTRQVAAALGVNDKKVRAWLRDAGVTRSRGARSRLDPDEVRKARKGRRQAWSQVARSLSTPDAPVSETGVKKAYRHRYGDTGLIDRYTHLTGPQRTQLRTLWDAIPPPPTGTGHHAASAEGKQIVALLRAHRDAGVRTAELGDAIGVSGAHIRQLTGPRKTAKTAAASGRTGES